MKTHPMLSALLQRGIILTLALLPEISASAAQSAARPPPTHAEVRYGPHERNVLDFWKADSAQPTPFVLFIHGGGFAAGGKEDLNAAILGELLAAGISVAATNYRYYQQAPLPAALHDCRRALQFVRSMAGPWNLDKSRAATNGPSAGAVASMYLAFHDDMADPQSADPVARESTRVTCVATRNGPTTMDWEWRASNVPGWPRVNRGPDDSYAFKRWGITDDAVLRAVVLDVSALHLISRDDPPIWMTYAMAPDAEAPTDLKRVINWRIHHVAYGVALKKQMDALGMEATLVYPGSKSSTDKSDAARRYNSPTQFLIAKLKAAK